LIVICISLGYLISSLFEYKYYNQKQREVLALQSELAVLKNRYPEMDDEAELIKQV
jgi:hypothetical protein